MRSTPTHSTLLLVALTIGATVGAGTARAGADRAAPEILRTNLDPGARMLTIAHEPPTASPGAITRLTSAGAGDAADDVQSAMRQAVDEAPGRPSGGTIRVAVHVITAAGEGRLSDDQIAGQILELSRDFAGTGYRFELSTIDRTENAAWFGMTAGSEGEAQAKGSLALDPAHRLNLYTCGPAATEIGWASLPWSTPEGHPAQGVVIHHAAFPEGATPRRLPGAVTVEVGRYLGLRPGPERASAAAGGAETPWWTPTGLTASAEQRIRAVVPVYRPSLVSEAVAPSVARPEIVPDAGAEPEDGRVLSYRGAFPNPFRAETALRFTLPASAPVSLRIYSVTGQLVRTLVEAQLPPGDHSAMFRAGELPSGAYFAVLRVGRVQMNRTLMLIR